MAQEGGGSAGTQLSPWHMEAPPPLPGRPRPIGWGAGRAVLPDHTCNRILTPPALGHPPPPRPGRLHTHAPRGAPAAAEGGEMPAMVAAGQSKHRTLRPCSRTARQVSGHKETKMGADCDRGRMTDTSRFPIFYTMCVFLHKRYHKKPQEIHIEEHPQ